MISVLPEGFSFEIPSLPKAETVRYASLKQDAFYDNKTNRIVRSSRQYDCINGVLFIKRHSGFRDH